MIGEAPGDAEKRAAVVASPGRDCSLDQMTRTVQFMARLKPRITSPPGYLDAGVQVAIVQLSLRQQRSRLCGELGKVTVSSAAELPADRLQRLVDVGVHEGRTLVSAVHSRDG